MQVGLASRNEIDGGMSQFTSSVMLYWNDV